MKTFIETLFRLIPFPVKTGLIKSGNPDENSPVLLTGNFDLTVRRVKKALKGKDAWILVANSKGINVWCAATGGHLTNHEVISVIKTSGIEKKVSHKKIILPQLAATGIDHKEILKKTRWKVIWGPVYIEDVNLFIENNFQKEPAMYQVKFDFKERMEMGIMWATPVSLVVSGIVVFFKPEIILKLNAMIWGLTFILYSLFPFYSGFFKKKKKVFSEALSMTADMLLPPLIVWIIFMFFSYEAGWLNEGKGVVKTFLNSQNYFWEGSSFFTLLLLLVDLMGTTPVYKSSLQKDRFFTITLNKDLCKGAGFCEDVCPKNCFEVDHKKHTASIPRELDCVQCGACVVQCPFDALYFTGTKGEKIRPEQIRTFKLNLMGKREDKKNMKV